MRRDYPLNPNRGGEQVKLKRSPSPKYLLYASIYVENTKVFINIYKYKLIHTPKQTVWSSRPHKYQDGFKVFISTTSYYGTFVDNCGMTQSIAFIMCKNETEAKNINYVYQPCLKMIISY